MSRTWQTDEVIRQLADADLDELTEVIEGQATEQQKPLLTGYGKEKLPRVSTTR